MGIFGNPASGYATPELSAQRQLSALGDIGQEEGAASASDASRMNQQRLGQLGTLAGLSAPVSYNKKSRAYGTSSGQSSGSGTGNTVTTQPGQGLFGSILSGLASGVGGALPFL